MGLEKFLGRFIPIFSVGSVRHFHCKKCNTYTEQVQIPFSDLHIEDTSPFVKGMVAILAGELNPMTGIGVGAPHRCKICGTVTFKGGIFSDTLEKNNEKGGYEFRGKE